MKVFGEATAVQTLAESSPLGIDCVRLIALSVSFIPRDNAFRWVSLVAFVALIVYSVAVMIYEVIAGTSYFREKYRQGYKVGPYADIPRKSILPKRNRVDKAASESSERLAPIDGTMGRDT